MNDDDPPTVKRMLLYLYTRDYPDGHATDIPTEHVTTDFYIPPQLRRKVSTTTEEETNLDTNPGPVEVATPHDSGMMNNALVYAVAEKYDIPELKELAKHKFQILACYKWPHDDFHAVTDTVFSTTPDQDMGLRQIILDICGEHFQDILTDEESKAAFLENKAIAAAVLDAAVRKNEQDKVSLDGALAKQIALQDEISQAKKDVQEALDEKNAWMSRLDSLIRNANNLSECRHCHEDFNWCFERLEGLRVTSGLGMQLRCMKCRTKRAL